MYVGVAAPIFDCHGILLFLGQARVEELESALKHMTVQVERDKARADDAEMAAAATYKNKVPRFIAPAY